MKLQFFGATGTVTGSKTVLTTDDGKYLVDCGMFQGLKQNREKNWARLPFRAAEIKAVFLTHAHIDHSGLLPLLVKDGFAGHIYCTPATRRLCEILLMDSAKIQEEDASYANRKGFSKHSPALPLFTTADVTRTLQHFKQIDLESPYQLGSLTVTFRSAGHILGAASILIEADRQRICFSGDLGRADDRLMNAPVPFTQADTIVCESTYGDKIHQQVPNDDQVAKIINETIRNEGTIVIPAFAVGRAQTILQILARISKEKKIPRVPIYLDSPMAIRATHLFSDFLGEHKLSGHELLEIERLVKFVETAEESKRVTLSATPKIILSASGMATGGRVLHHLKAFLPSHRNAVIMVGYQAVGTRGASLVHHAESIKIHGQLVPVNAKIHILGGYSAHADQAGLLAWVRNFEKPPRNVFLNHGEPESTEALRIVLRDNLHIRAIVPEYATEFELANGG